MQIHGLQKMTLLDFPGVVSCTVFLGGCDFRCPFCHNYELADGTAKPVMEDDDLIDFLRRRKPLLDGVAITGGEPCLHPGLPELIERIRAEGYRVKLDTNGYHPARLQGLLDAGLVDYVAMDIKNSEEKYVATCGLHTVDLGRIKESIGLLMNGQMDYEFRTTVVREFHEAEDFERMGEMIRGAKRYFLQRFTDRDTVPFGNLSAPSFDDMKAYAAIARRYVADTRLRGVE
ncbi:MAG: anaerobic ribonucleoside-triphosphate reductase activating protein [Clostridia bacterium]|nr:anaerobic ribonucleoside-triphosphate reductase activating protein [Clostridia bacterium]